MPASTRAEEATTNRADVLKQQAANTAVLANWYGVTGLALFGLVVRDPAPPGRDVDILVSFDGLATSSRYFGVQLLLEDLLGRRLDLVTDEELRAELRPYIEREAVHA